MTFTERHRSPQRVIACVVLLLTCLTISNFNFGVAFAAQDFAGSDFQNVWNRTDKLVANGGTSRTFLWGPQPNTGGLQEPYEEAPGGKRLVQYFDKSRMEITNPAGDKSSPYYVTNGLIARELMSGQMQVGNTKFVKRLPSTVGVAGDVDDTNGPTYATMGGLTDASTDATGNTITQAIDRAGNKRDGTAEFSQYSIKQANFDKTTNHNIAQPFWDFLNQTGPVLGSDGQTATGRLFDPVFYATGLPITEAWWSKVKVAGQVKDVLVQSFERRVLTYTPANPTAYQVEMGNVGQHYYDWRYNPKFDISTEPVRPTVNNCKDLPADKGGFSLVRCGIVGMQLILIGTNFQPNETVQVYSISPDGGQPKKLGSTDANKDGIVSLRFSSLKTDKPGFWTYQIVGVNSATKDEAYVWMDPSRDSPTIFATSLDAKLTSLLGFAIVGFNPGEQISYVIKSPNGTEYRSNFTIQTGAGGGYTLIFRASTDIPNAGPGEWTLTAVSTADNTRFAGIKFKLS